jgi:hypothetical protein
VTQPYHRLKLLTKPSVCVDSDWTCRTNRQTALPSFVVTIPWFLPCSAWRVKVCRLGWCKLFESGLSYAKISPLLPSPASLPCVRKFRNSTTAATLTLTFTENQHYNLAPKLYTHSSLVILAILGIHIHQYILPQMGSSCTSATTYERFHVCLVATTAVANLNVSTELSKTDASFPAFELLIARGPP